MIAASYRMAIHDFLLIFLSTVVVVLSVIPSGPPRQDLFVHDPSGIIQRYSIATDDPRLASIREQIATHARPNPPAILGWNKWLAEACEFYAVQTQRSLSDEGAEIQQASFSSKPNPSLAANLIPATLSDSDSPANGRYWSDTADQARARIDAIERVLAARKAELGPPPIRLGSIHPTATSLGEYSLAALAGCFVGLLWCLWGRFVHPITLNSQLFPSEHVARSLVDRSESRPGISDKANGMVEMPLVIPADWVRIRQPIAVILHRCAYAAIVIAGAATAVPQLLRLST